MESLESIDKLYYVLGFGILTFIGYKIIEKKKSFKLMLQYQVCVYGTAMYLLSLTIPNVFSGFPYELSDLENKKMVFHHLQKSNAALADLIDAVRNMVFITVLFFLSIIIKIIKNFKIEQTADSTIN